MLITYELKSSTDYTNKVDILRISYYSISNHLPRSNRSDFTQEQEHRETLKLLMKHTKMVEKEVMAYWLPDNKLPVRGATPPPPQYLQYQGHASFQVRK